MTARDNKLYIARVFLFFKQNKSLYQNIKAVFMTGTGDVSYIARFIGRIDEIIILRIYTNMYYFSFFWREKISSLNIAPVV
jgi:hypothetical protein